MTTATTTAEVLEVSDIQALDRIVVYWHDITPGVGHVTITCYGSAWTSYFGAMGGRSIRAFFVACDVDYLVTKLGIASTLKERRSDLLWLGKIIATIKMALAESAA